MSAKLYTSMAEAIQELKKRGFTSNFEFLDQTVRGVVSTRRLPLRNEMVPLR